MALGDCLASGVLVTFGDCRLLDGLVIGSVEARVKLVRGSGEGFVWGSCAHPRGRSRRATLVEERLEECQGESPAWILVCSSWSLPGVVEQACGPGC